MEKSAVLSFLSTYLISFCLGTTAYGSIYSFIRSLVRSFIHHACIYACPSTLYTHTHISFFHSFYFYFTHLLLEACTHCFPRCASLIWSDNVCDQSRRTHLPVLCIFLSITLSFSLSVLNADSHPLYPLLPLTLIPLVSVCQCSKYA